MAAPRTLTRLGALYVYAVILAGAAVIVVAIHDLAALSASSGNRWFREWLALAALTLLSGSATVRLPSVPATISISETFVFTAVLLFGPAAGVVIVALDGLIISFWFAKRRKELFRVAFNMAAPGLSIWLAAQIYFSFPNVGPIGTYPGQSAVSLGDLIIPLAFFACTHFLVNSWLIALAVAAETDRAPIDIWRNDFLWLSLNYFGGASVSALLVVYTRNIDFTYLSIIVPLLLILYFTFKIPMARVEDTNRHLTEVNRLYLSTIETLAMAIDAKDQVTHGHIRRVQGYALGLASELGVAAPDLVRAIEASALLHDMGKLAIPEHILNKPGRLTAAEFEKMKLHASVGADILSAIQFPYPVIPIVRHHHENWDGTGYPAGLAGTDIPIGARILSVVDCFDALTSDRPYRKRLSDEAALAILAERRGNMYDPHVVDTFVRVYREITPQEGPVEDSTESALAHVARSGRALDEPANADNSSGLALNGSILDMYQWVASCADHTNYAETVTFLTQRLRTVLEASSSMLLAYNVSSDTLIAEHVSDERFKACLGKGLPVGQGIAGWVAANRRPVMNSDPLLDLGLLAPELEAGELRCLSVPLQCRGALFGVINLYSRVPFSQEQLRVAEAMSAAVADGLARSAAAAKERTQPFLDPVTGLPTVQMLHRGLAGGWNRYPIFPVTVLAIRLRGTNQNSFKLLSCLRTVLRSTDLLFQGSEQEYICLLQSTDYSTGTRIVNRLLSADAVVDLPRGALQVGLSDSTRDSDDIRILVELARQRSSDGSAAESVA